MVSKPLPVVLLFVPEKVFFRLLHEYLNLGLLGGSLFTAHLLKEHFHSSVVKNVVNFVRLGRHEVFELLQVFFVGPSAPFTQVLHDAGRDWSLVVNKGRALASIERTRGLAVVLKHLTVDFFPRAHFQLFYGYLRGVLLMNFILLDTNRLDDAHGFLNFLAWL